jgi:alpha-mannosidase
MSRSLVFGIAVAATFILATAQRQAEANGGQDSCLLVSAENIVSAEGNWFLYVEISDTPCTFQPGDRLEYDILLPALNPRLQGGIDAELKRENLPEPLKTRPWLRDAGIRDQDGVTLHGTAVLESARDRWHHRSFDLAPAAGGTAERWMIAFEGDQPGRYIQLLDNIRVTRDGDTVCWIYENGEISAKIRMIDGYSRTVLVTTAERETVLSDERVVALLDQARRDNDLRTARAQFHAELDVARRLATHLHDQNLLTAIEAAAREEDAAAFEAGELEAYARSLARGRQNLSHAHPQMQRFTGHLVGHAHIDLQWLWSWDETVNQIIPQTFGQAIRFMQEFPDFTFTQSSAALYLATEQHHPELFKQIQEYAASGRWEPVGGRWCEGDMNMISPESHARHFLYAQRYFQDRFGHICTVGWEPDTFGHPWTMPQILSKAGIDSYYFCRAGKNVPLFWWEAPDGSRVLAFEEPPTGGWYIDVVSDEQVRELADFVATTGASDHLMVYGVGNHGGGPTRENIEAAIAMRERQPWPNVKFSTASEFFRRLHEQADSLDIPTIRDELNSVFEGCYTTHSRIKRYNRDSEALLESAEVFAALAALTGPAYPREAFASLWRDVLWNHHHDTLPGSFIHASSLYSAKMYDALRARGTDLLRRAQAALAARIDLASSEPGVIVFNPLAWSRSEIVEAAVTLPVTTRLTTLYDEEGDLPLQILERKLDGENVTLRFCFVARGVPGCGFKVFRNRGPASRTAAPITEQTVDEVYPVPTAQADPAQAVFGHLAPCFQILHEEPHGMSAWTIGAYGATTELRAPLSIRTVESGPLRQRFRTVYRFDQSTITQDIIHCPDSARVDYETTVDWQQLGNKTDGGPMLKVGFATNLDADTATYDIPFGDITRTNDGHENVALKWCALSGRVINTSTEQTIAVLNDCKHAYDVKDGVIRLTLLRSPYAPDPTPDIGVHQMRYAVLPTDGPLDKAALTRAAWEFNKPLQVRVHEGTDDASSASSSGVQTTSLPPAWSGCQAEPANIIVTCLKRAERNDDFIIRAYECAGRATSATISLGFDAKGAVENDLLERETDDAPPVTLSGRLLRAPFKPYEIRTIRLRME